MVIMAAPNVTRDCAPDHLCANSRMDHHAHHSLHTNMCVCMQTIRTSIWVLTSASRRNSMVARMARCIRMLATGKVSEPIKFGSKLSRLAYTSWLSGMELVSV